MILYTIFVFIDLLSKIVYNILLPNIFTVILSLPKCNVLLYLVWISGWIFSYENYSVLYDFLKENYISKKIPYLIDVNTCGVSKLKAKHVYNIQM